MNSGGDRRSRMYRVLRPTLHTSAKPQFIRGRQLEQRYSVVLDLEQAEELWDVAYKESESTRIKEVHMLSGAILPVWSSLQAAIRDVGGSKQEQSLTVKRGVVQEKPIIGVALSQEQIAKFKEKLRSIEGGRSEDVKAAAVARQRQVKRAPLAEVSSRAKSAPPRAAAAFAAQQGGPSEPSESKASRPSGAPGGSKPAVEDSDDDSDDDAGLDADDDDDDDTALTFATGPAHSTFNDDADFLDMIE